VLQNAVGLLPSVRDRRNDINFWSSAYFKVSKAGKVTRSPIGNCSSIRLSSQ